MADVKLSNFRQIEGTNLYRSATPDELSPAHLNRLKTLGIKHIYDLRNEAGVIVSGAGKPIRQAFALCKVTRKGSHVNYQVMSPPEGQDQPSHENKHYMFNLDEHRYRDIIYAEAAWYIRLWLAIIGVIDALLGTNYYQKSFVAHILGKTQLYEYLVYGMEEWRNSIYAVLKALCENGNSPAVLCCFLGRDRTGVLAALIQTCMGWSDEDIVKDFAKSQEGLTTPPLREILHAELRKRNWTKLNNSWLGALPSDIQGLLRYLKTKYGSVEGYMDSIGFLEADREKLRSAIRTSK